MPALESPTGSGFFEPVYLIFGPLQVSLEKQLIVYALHDFRALQVLVYTPPTSKFPG